MNKLWVWVGFPVGIGVMLLLLVFMGGEPAAPTTPKGLKIEDLQAGDGPAVKTGDTVTVNYKGAFKDGTVFDSSFDRKKPLTFTVGKGNLIQGWHLGLIGMKAGGVRKLTIAPELAYGKKGRPPVIPPNSELQFVIQLLDIEH